VNGERDDNTPIGDPVTEFLERFEQHMCPSCTFVFRRVRGSEMDVCPGCLQRRTDEARLERENAELRQNAPRWIQHYLTQAGMSERERAATVERIPQTLRRKLTKSTTAELLASGAVPSVGFGISGDAGVGKTMALAAMMKQHTLARWSALGPKLGVKVAKLSLAWVRWPETVNGWRVEATKDGGLVGVSHALKRLELAPMLVLDDLGAERIKTAYSDDWASSQLDLLIARRYDGMLPTWFTTNLKRETFAERYGARLFSRLCGNSPFIVATGLDLRVQKGTADAGD
jgi:Zn-finger nucleic acid-binding protein